MDQKTNTKLTNIDICYTKDEEIKDNIRVVYTEDATSEIALNTFKTGLLIGGLSVVVAKWAIVGFKTLYGDKKVSKKPVRKSKKNSK